MGTSEWIALGALGVALFSAVVSVFSYCVSQSAFKISKQQHKERYKGITPYYIDALKWKSQGEIYVSFALRFTNEATISNSIQSIELHLEYFDRQRKYGKAKISPNLEIKPVNLASASEVLAVPLELNAKSAKSGWISFKLPSLFSKELDIDLYKIVASTTDGRIVSIDTHIIKAV
ncbi:hypothetical protein [Shewanella algae]|uniref:hypothetical protein n=1 Tax=Shewanella algae TaxID=38313 RepID=UPI001AAD836D|nr:hypothetical protein [Shewanella algae]MBO2650814.1 hypothetical protein [Shewanella algae]